MATADNTVTVEANAERLHKAIDRLLEILPARVKAAARISATNIDTEAHRRVRRRTGRTAAGIVVREIATGFVVEATAPAEPQTARGAAAVPVWLDFGATSMRFGAKPFLRVAGQLEHQAHEARVRDVIAEAITEVGLGD